MVLTYESKISAMRHMAVRNVPGPLAVLPPISRTQSETGNDEIASLQTSNGKSGCTPPSWPVRRRESRKHDEEGPSVQRVDEGRYVTPPIHNSATPELYPRAANSPSHIEALTKSKRLPAPMTRPQDRS
ncbi:uncharacterized protein BDV17DRAFT_74818 [Aspergillus undulatus]|uniref:uncharacterized protein n=1 Tax=Aspergillus undulatus TaxID=1810928 RepID=UPI003CCD3F11